ncbi:hypothetical protein SAMN02745247_00527 [Butyrivibrio hungatei DSM 14810]|uniref:DUF4366 domain-containing protein n=1 Tax=Butyrivibrio hungatei DSM 14810 TaxID=1121132 RepID=A0A1M7RWP2_9FIRM|nr:hypothetical protein [Butyrivibrio hungatei]SHN50534.1 hypothetical protein SAMN02745247_00527 [Butyrivibrio hungatei DSM 14810]
MSKNNGFGKFILFCTAVGAAAAGAYYYLSKREAEIADEFDDEDYEDVDDFEDDLEEEKDYKNSSRRYVDIKTSSETGDSSKEPSSSEEFFDDEESK